MLKYWPLVAANLRHRPARTVLAFVATLLAFALYGLALGEAVGFARAAAAHHVNIGRGFLLVAMAAAAAGMALILFLTTSAMAQATRLRIGEFGVLKAIGFSHGLILALVTAEAALPCLAGAVGGLLAAKLLYILLTTLLPPLAVFPPLVYTPDMLAIAGLLALIIGGVSGALPAARIIRLEAAEALAGALQPAAPSHEFRAATTQPKSAAMPIAEQADIALGVVIKANPHPLRQILVVTRIGLSTLPHRWKGAAVVVVGVGTMAFALLSILCVAEGIRSGILDSGDPSRALIYEANSYEAGWLAGNVLPRNAAALATAAPGVAHAKDGTALVDAELFFHTVRLIKRNNGEEGRTLVMGTSPHWREMTPSFRLLSGRLPRAGTRELIAGTLAARKFSGLDVGFVDYQGQRWPVVGTFRAGDWWDGYLVGDAAMLKAATRSNGNSLVRVRLASANAFGTFQHYIATRMPANVIIERETDYYAHFWDRIPKVIFYTAYLLGGLVGSGALAATTQMMQGAVEERAREIAVLRALGFNGLAAATSVVIEALLLAALGAFFGTALVWLWLDGFLYNGATSVFRVTVDLHLLLVAIAWGIAVAIPGTFIPAVRLARQTPIDALREVQRCALHFASPRSRTTRSGARMRKTATKIVPTTSAMATGPLT
jgi:putative ABC transport system permease protein